MLLREWGGPGVSGCLWKVALIRVPGKPASLPPSPFPSLVQELKEAQLVSDEALREEVSWPDLSQVVGGMPL